MVLLHLIATDLWLLFFFLLSPEAYLSECQQQAIWFQSIWECQLKLIYAMIGLPQSSVPTTTHCGLRRREFAFLPASDEEGGFCDVGYSSLELNISDHFFTSAKSSVSILMWRLIFHLHFFSIYKCMFLHIKYQKHMSPKEETFCLTNI